MQRQLVIQRIHVPFFDVIVFTSCRNFGMVLVVYLSKPFWCFACSMLDLFLCSKVSDNWIIYRTISINCTLLLLCVVAWTRWSVYLFPRFCGDVSFNLVLSPIKVYVNVLNVSKLIWSPMPLLGTSWISFVQWLYRKYYSRAVSVYMF